MPSAENLTNTTNTQEVDLDEPITQTGIDTDSFKHSIRLPEGIIPKDPSEAWANAWTTLALISPPIDVPMLQ